MLLCLLQSSLLSCYQNFSSTISATLCQHYMILKLNTESLKHFKDLFNGIIWKSFISVIMAFFHFVLLIIHSLFFFKKNVKLHLSNWRISVPKLKWSIKSLWKQHSVNKTINNINNIIASIAFKRTRTTTDQATRGIVLITNLLQVNLISVGWFMWFMKGFLHFTMVFTWVPKSTSRNQLQNYESMLRVITLGLRFKGYIWVYIHIRTHFQS